MKNLFKILAVPAIFSLVLLSSSCSNDEEKDIINKPVATAPIATQPTVPPVISSPTPSVPYYSPGIVATKSFSYKSVEGRKMRETNDYKIPYDFRIKKASKSDTPIPYWYETNSGLTGKTEHFEFYNYINKDCIIQLRVFQCDLGLALDLDTSGINCINGVIDFPIADNSLIHFIDKHHLTIGTNTRVFYYNVVQSEDNYNMYDFYHNR